jgi:hypothetical protein
VLRAWQFHFVIKTDLCDGPKAVEKEKLLREHLSASTGHDRPLSIIGVVGFCDRLLISQPPRRGSTDAAAAPPSPLSPSAALSSPSPLTRSCGGGRRVAPPRWSGIDAAAAPPLPPSHSAPLSSPSPPTGQCRRPIRRRGSLNTEPREFDPLASDGGVI